MSYEDPNVEVLSSSPTYDPSFPVKRWVDKRAGDTSYELFAYKKYSLDANGKVVARRFILNREDAGKANIPTPEALQASKDYNKTEIPVPNRDPDKDEVVSVSPFNQVIYTKVSAAPAGTSPEVFDLLNKILGKVESIEKKLSALML